LDVETAMKLYGISEYFRFILSSEEIGAEKPNPLVFGTIIQRIEELPENIVYVGDDPVRDIVGAKKLGMKGILYLPPKNYRKSVPWRKYDIEIPKEFEPDATIRDLQELKRLIV
jgi:putative hydrolase of the HAD superfamily